MKVLTYCVVIAVTAIVSIIAFGILEGDELPEKNVLMKSFRSEILGEEREVIIRLPRLYNPARQYPIIYALDGGSLDRMISHSLQTLVTAGVAPEAIVVGIPNMSAENREVNLTPPFMRQENEDVSSSPGEADRFLKFLEQELIPFVEKEYKATSRVFCGNSRGGLTVIYSITQTPMLFDARICFSTPVWRQDNILIDSTSRFLEENEIQSFIYLSAGEAETENIRGGLNRITNVLKQYPNLVVHSSLTPEAVHANNAEYSLAEALVQWANYEDKKSQ